MCKYLFLWRWFPLKPSLTLIFIFLIAFGPIVQAHSEEVSRAVPVYSLTSSQTSTTTPSSSSTDMIYTEVQEVTTPTQDPLNSPHPVPWQWVLATYEELSYNQDSGISYYRSPSLISPDGKYAAYTRIQMQGEPELFRSRVTSVLFLENLQTGDLQTVTASSPLADNPFNSNEEAGMPGTISILIPVSWSQKGDRILARQFEGIFSTSYASDYAVIWNRQTGRTSTVAPKRVAYTNAVLLGWSQINPQKVLFRAGTLGEEKWPIWAVNTQGQTQLASEDAPIVYGRMVDQIWTGPQARW